MEPVKSKALRAGFSRGQQAAILFLAVLFVTGTGIRLYRRMTPPRIPEKAAVRFAALPLPAEKKQAAVPAEPAVPVKPVPQGPLNINTATAAQLTALPRIGPALAARIVAYREAHGPFKAAEDLTAVKGIGPKTLSGFADRITAGDGR